VLKISGNALILDTPDRDLKYHHLFLLLTSTHTLPAWQHGDQNWANFRLLGDCLLGVVLVKITEVVKIIGLLFPRY
jgi:hypothetical protein